MEGEFREALETLRYELKEELRPLVEHRLLSEKPDDIVRNNWHRLLHKFEELIQRKKNRIQGRLNEIQQIQQKLGDIKLEDIEKSLERIRRKQGELEKELRRSDEHLKNILKNILEERGLINEIGKITSKQAKLKLELELMRLEGDLKKKNIQGRPMSEVEKIRRKQRELKKELRSLHNLLEDLLEEDLNKIIAFFPIEEFIFVNRCVGIIDGLIRNGLIREGEYRLVEPYLKKCKHLIEEMTKLGVEENELELKRKNLFEIPFRKKGLLKELKKIKLIEAQSDGNKIREFIKDLIKEMRQEKLNEIYYEPEYYYWPDDDVLS